MKMSQNIVQKSILRFHIILESSILNLYLKKLVQKQFSCKNGLLNCQNTNTLYRFPNFESLFLKINYSSNLLTFSMKFAIRLVGDRWRLIRSVHLPTSRRCKRGKHRKKPIGFVQGKYSKSSFSATRL